MGKIIVKNISYMGWKARIGLIAIFTLLISLFIYDGLYRARGSIATVVTGTAWQSVHAAAPAAAVGKNNNYVVTSSAGYTPAAGSSRLLLVSVYYELVTASMPNNGMTVTYGGATVNPIVTTTGTARTAHVWLGYVADANIPAGSSTVTATYTRNSVATTVSSVAIKVGTYNGVDQGSPIVGSTVNQAANVTVAGAAAVSYVTGGKTVVATSNGGVTATPAYTATPTLTTNAGATSTTGQSAYIAETAAHASSSSGTVSITYSGTTTANSTIAVASLRPAVTTLGIGINGTSANVAPGAANQKLGGFSLVTGSAGTTDSITDLTVTTTGYNAIGSISIWNEAGSTQYFTTVNNPASNTIAFSGGTPLPVTSTAANFKIQVTYKTRGGGAPSGLTSTTAYVSALTSTNTLAGSDSAETTLTLSNVHAASTWGTCTASDNQVLLNWTKGTGTQSLIIVRYTNAASDTTKPVDGNTYTVGTGFGTGGTIRYNGAGTTYTDTSGVVNGTTYYYKIFEYDTYNNYYNASDVWTPALTPVTSDPEPPVVAPGFAASTPVNTVNIPITDGSFFATDVGSGVAGYFITLNATPPSAGAGGWSASPHTTFTVAGEGVYTLYPWAKDAASQVSAVYSAPLTVTVDLTKPTVTAFSVTYDYVPGSAVKTFQIPVGSFTGSDTGGSGLNAYMITTTATAPANNDPNWLGSPPASYTVVSDNDYTLYPWVRDAAGNVSNLFGSPRTVKVDTTPPSGMLPSSPADEAIDLPQATSVSSTPATDGSGVGGILYQFQLDGDDASSINSGWQASTTYSPSLVKGVRYVWKVKAKDNLGLESAYSTPRSFTIIAPCVRNNPTLTLLTTSGGIAKTITAFEGTADYELKIWNNDTGDCGSTTFNLSLADVVPGDYTGHFLPTVFTENSLTTIAVNLPTGGTSTKVVQAKSAPDEDTGVMSTTATAAADPNHQAQTTGFVQTTLNVVTCVAKTPLLIVGPDSGYVNRAGKFVYTITVKNTDTGSACPNVVYNLTVPTETNSTDFDASLLNTASLTLGSGQLGSATLTVSAKSTATKNAFNISTIHVGAGGHTSPADVTVRSTVNNPMLHNSDNVNSTKWSVSGGWGIPNGRYGEIRCETCHVGGGGDTSNAKRINERIYTPYTSGAAPKFPGDGQTVAYRRYIGVSPTQPVLGWDAGATPRAGSTRVCEVCHTYDASRTNGAMAHPYSTGATLGNHFNTDGTDCTRCHKHNLGFGAANMLCTGCHGNNAVTEINAANRFVVAPPTTTTGATGTLTGTGLVSNNPKVGAHQTHLQLLNGFTNYSSVDFRCVGCHGNGSGNGTIPTNFTHADGSSIPVFQGLANNRGARTPSFSSANLTCSNTYCHNPAGTGGTLAAANSGSAIFPSWTTAGYIADGTAKTDNNCNRCHKVPGSPGFSFQASHSETTVVGYDCTGCHGHNGDSAGEVGKRHIDGIRYAGGNCNHCHGYDSTDAGSTWLPALNVAGGSGAGLHAKHINFIKSRLNIASLTPVGQIYGAGEPMAICGSCHSNNTSDHTPGQTGSRLINFGSGSNTMGSGYIGSMTLQFGPSNPSFDTGPKNCSNLLCHYATTPSWY